MAHISLEADNVFHLDMTLEEARDAAGAYDLSPLDDVLGVIDEAQGHVHMGKGTVSYVVIEIRR